MNQAELRQLAEERIHDAQVLLAGGRWEFAYYVAGYAVECALKSCILSRMILTGWVFKDAVRRTDECRTHDLETLLQIAGLQAEWGQRTGLSKAFEDNWEIVIQWKVESRYLPKTQAEAETLFNAIAHDPDGVLIWLKNFW